MNVDTQLPESGTGFVTSNRGDHGQFQFGQKSSIDAALAVGAAWDALHPNHPFSIGQISKEGGGDFPPHASHKVGLDIDVRPMRLDGKNEPVEITESQYDRNLTTELIDLWWQKAPVLLVYFNEVQTKLGLEADGRFGPKTLLAVEAFQSERGLTPDGVVGPQTWAALATL